MKDYYYYRNQDVRLKSEETDFVLAPNYRSFAADCLNEALQCDGFVSTDILCHKFYATILGKTQLLWFKPANEDYVEWIMKDILTFLQVYTVLLWTNGVEKGVHPFIVSYICDLNKTAVDGFRLKINPVIAEFEKEILTMAKRDFLKWLEDGEWKHVNNLN